MDEISSRQTFLGPNAENLIRNTVVGIVGLSGGGSHVVQQLRHVGFRRFRTFDPQDLERSNLNRVVIATPADIGKSKVELARRAIRDFYPDAEISDYQGTWQERPDLLQECDLVVGCIDGFSERNQLEIACRRHLIPLVDVGMDVAPGDPPTISGQVILSMPGHQCMWCMGFLNKEVLEREAAKYGAAGPNPQVVWPNGVLASTAIGIVVALVTGWTKQRGALYLTYDGNRGIMIPHPCIGRMPECPHFNLAEAGSPIFKPL